MESVEGMSICWYCHWGWPKAVADIYLAALADLDGDSHPLHFGPGHIVWDDENFDCAQSCLDTFEEYSRDLTAEEAVIVRRSLEELATLPEAAYEVTPAAYDGEHPELYPPATGLIMLDVDYNPPRQRWPIVIP